MRSFIQTKGLESVWSGKMAVKQTTAYAGAKEWNCDITLAKFASSKIEEVLELVDKDEALAARDLTYLNVLMHELTHSVNTITPKQYATPHGRALEEGLTEHFSRRSVIDLVGTRGIKVEQGALAKHDTYPMAYSPWVESLREIDKILPETALYELKYKVEPSDRVGYLLRLIAEPLTGAGMNEAGALKLAAGIVDYCIKGKVSKVKEKVEEVKNYLGR